MGAAAALIPGIAGIAGGQYMKNREENQQADMMRNRIASAGRFLGQEQLPQVNSMGVRPPVQTQLEPGIGGDATRRALEARSMSGKARQFAIEQASFGNSKPLEALVTSQMAPERDETDYGNSPQEGINPLTGEIEQFVINKKNGQKLWLGTKPAPKAAEGFKVGATRDIRKGNETVTEEWDGTKFVEIARGSAFAPPAPKDQSEEQMKREMALGAEWTPINNALNTSYQNVQKVYSLLESGDPVALTYAIKALEQANEPGAIVRESDVDLIRAAQAKLNEWKAKMSQMTTGAPISVDMAKDIANAAGILATVSKKAYQDRVDAQSGRFKAYGVRPENVAWASTISLPQYNPKSAKPTGLPGPAVTVTEKRP